MPLRHPDPRTEPVFRPRKWQAALRQRRLWVRVGVAVAAGVGSLLIGLLPLDRTSRLLPEEVARQAGEQLSKAGKYRFQVELEGASADGSFPQARMSGAYQSDPPVLHLAGNARTGERLVPLEYYLEGADLYVQEPTRRDWVRVRNADLDELRSFRPGTLAAPLVSGVQKATPAGRERLAGGEALVLDLELAPEHRPRLGGQGTGDVAYRLWVYTRTLKPAQLMIGYKARDAASDLPGSPGTASSRESRVLWFSYVVTWDFSAHRAVAVPEQVKQSAREASR